MQEGIDEKCVLSHDWSMFDFDPYIHVHDPTLQFTHLSVFQGMCAQKLNVCSRPQDIYTPQHMCSLNHKHGRRCLGEQEGKNESMWEIEGNTET